MSSLKYITTRSNGLTPIAIFAALILALLPMALADSLVRRAVIIDGNMLAINGKHVRLRGIDAPEPDQFCRNQASEPYRCGRKAAEGVDALIARRPVDCVEADRDQDKRRLVVCNVAGVDIAEWLVKNGLAIDAACDGKGAYAAAQSDAKREQRGIWSGGFVEPWRYRRCRRSGGTIAGCSDQQDDSAL
jgi:endonuclease YncB( thermonuclease family)